MAIKAKAVVTARMTQDRLIYLFLLHFVKINMHLKEMGRNLGSATFEQNAEA